MLNSWKNFPLGLWIVVLAHGITDLSAGALFVALPFLKAKFALSYAQVSAIALMQNLTSSVSQPIFGYFSDRRPRAWLMPFGCVISGMAMLASLAAPHYYLVMLFTAISGFGIAAFHPEAAKAANRLSGAAKGKGVSMFAVGGNAGFAMGSLFLAALLYGGMSLKTMLYVVPFLVVSWALKSLIASFPPAEGAKAAGSSSMKGIISWPLLALLGMVLTRSTVASGLSTFVPLYYISYLQGSEIYANSLLTVFLGAGAVGTIFGGILSDRFGSKQVMLYSTLPVALLLYLFPGAGQGEAFVVLSLISIFLSATFTGSLVLAQRMMPNNIGMASGLTIGLSVGLGAFGVYMLGKIADSWGLPVIFTVMAVLPVIGFFLTLFIEDPGTKQAKHAA